MGNKHFISEQCCRQTYQNYEQPTNIGHIFRKQSTGGSCLMLLLGPGKKPH